MRLKLFRAGVLQLGFFCASAALAWAQKEAPPPALAPKAAPALHKFDTTGPQVGDQVPDLRLQTLKGEVQRLSDAWRSGPALLVTSSLTCPKSRSRWPELKALVEKYDKQLNIVIVYVIEAHPVGSVCPYKDVEDVTPENERDGILRKQPKTAEERLQLAAEFQRLLRIETPIYVDNIKDEAWRGLGAAPNMALLVDKDGLVAARSGWFEGQQSAAAIDRYLAAHTKKQDAEENQEYLKTREQAQQVFDQLKKAGHDVFSLHRVLGEDAAENAKILKAVPALANAVGFASQGHPYEATMLMEAVKDRNLATVKLLLDHGADIKARTSSYESAFQIAAEQGDVELGKYLLERGADPKVPATGASPLHEAALHGHKDFVKLLLSSGVRHDLYSAIALGEVELVRSALQFDPSRALRPDGAYRMPLDYAAANGQLEIAKLLLASGAPVVRDKRVRIDPPLHRAIARDDLAMVELLLTAGSSPDVSVGWGGDGMSSARPALHAAVAEKNLKMVKLLLAHKADLKVRDTYSQTALHDAAERGEAEIAAALIAAGADVNAPQLGFSLPCGSGEEEIPTNTTPLHFAARSGNAATIKVLLDAGAKINAATKKGETPLMFAAASQRYAAKDESRVAIVELLIAKGADLKLEDAEGRSVLDFAEKVDSARDDQKKKDHADMLALLQKHGAKPGTPKKAPQPTAPSPGQPFATDPFAPAADPFGAPPVADPFAPPPAAPEKVPPNTNPFDDPFGK